MDARRRRNGPTFSVGHILGDPFALATISISILGWLVAIVASIITTVRGDEFNKFYWWALAYMLFCIVGVTTVVLTATQEQYQVAVVGFLAVAVTYNTFAVSAVVFSNAASQEAAAAGFILLSMISLLWIGYFGSAPQAKSRGYIDSFALNKEQRMSMRGSRPISTNPYDMRAPMSSGQAAPPMYTSAHMNGTLEQASNTSGYGGPNGSQPRFGQQPLQTSAPRSPTGMAPAGSLGGAPGVMQQQADVSPPSQQGPPEMAPADFPYRAKAIYSYEANPDDANEISFTKHEILEVSDVSGRWWQARKENGETGIAPSNYLILL